jgi:hypothetical protein
MPDANQKDIRKAIRAIQDIAVMLTGASEYVCEGRMLKRYSSEIETNLDDLETYLSRLKGSFPGKFPEALRPDSSLSKIRELATSMKGNEAKMEARCRAGELGNELFLGVKELKEVVADIRDTLGGKVVSKYSFSDRIAEQWEKLKYFLSGFSPLVSTTGKIILAVIILLILCFVYLYITMESEDVLATSINNDIAYIQTQKDELAKHRKEYEEITKNINALKKNILSRDEKIQLLNLSTESKKVKQSIDNSVLSIERKEKELADKKKRLEELRRKPLIQKLLKR